MTVEKRVRLAFGLSFVILVVHIIDVFFLHNDDSIFESNVFSRIIGLFLAVIVSAFLGLNLKKFCFKSYGVFFEFLYGAVFSVIPFLVIYVAKYFYFMYRGYGNLVLTFRPSGFSSDYTPDVFVIMSLLYVVSLLLISVFKEVFYRGFLISQLSSRFGTFNSIVIQSLIYTVSFVPTIIYSLIYGEFSIQSNIMKVFLVCGHIFYNWISGFKWGLYYKVNGTVWMSLADHFITYFITTSFFFTQDRLPEKWYIIELIAIQSLSFLMFLPVYFHRDKINEQAAEEYALSKEAMKLGVDDYSPSLIRKRFGALGAYHDGFNDGHQLKEEHELEEPVSFNSGQLLTEDDLTLSVRGYEINDDAFQYSNEISDHDSDPKEKSRAYFDNLMGRENERKDDVSDSDNTSGTDKISELVKDYFKDNFDKHTFTKK